MRPLLFAYQHSHGRKARQPGATERVIIFRKKWVRLVITAAAFGPAIT